MTEGVSVSDNLPLLLADFAAYSSTDNCTPIPTVQCKLIIIQPLASYVFLRPVVEIRPQPSDSSHNHCKVEIILTAQCNPAVRDQVPPSILAVACACVCLSTTRASALRRWMLRYPVYLARHSRHALDNVRHCLLAYEF